MAEHKLLSFPAHLQCHCQESFGYGFFFFFFLNVIGLLFLVAFGDFCSVMAIGIWH